jgi:hypothetical protein
MAPTPRRSFQSGWAAYYRIEGNGNMARAQIHHVGQNAPARTVCVSKNSTMCSLTQPRTRPMPGTGGTGDRIDRDRHKRPEATLILVGRCCAPAQKAMAGGRLYRASNRDMPPFEAEALKPGRPRVQAVADRQKRSARNGFRSIGDGRPEIRSAITTPV